MNCPLILQILLELRLVFFAHRLVAFQDLAVVKGRNALVKHAVQKGRIPPPIAEFRRERSRIRTTRNAGTLIVVIIVGGIVVV